MNKFITLLLTLAILGLTVYLVMFRAIVFSQLNYLNSEIERLDRFMGAVYLIEREK